MDRTAVWPWNLEEEAEWKADLEKQDDDILEELIETAAENGIAESRNVLEPAREEEPAGDGAPEKYLVTT
ncbi:MAG: hypothetical protein WCC04_08440 [Terriglobales bacterium]